MILETPMAERTIPRRKAIAPRIITSLPTATPILDPMKENDKMEKVAGNAEAKNFLQDGIDEIEAIVKNRTGNDKTNTTRNPSAHSVTFEVKYPAMAAIGNATTRRNHDRISSPMSLRKFRTFSP